MNIEHLIAQGNTFREQHQPKEALKCYAQAFVEDPDSASAWNNYGNVMREMGYPERSIPFLEHALRLAPGNSTASFNLAVSYLLMGDYERGWPQYESRWNYEHLAGTLPQFSQPRWTGQDVRGKTVLVTGEQGLGDTIQFVRFIVDLANLGADLMLQVPDGLVSLLSNGPRFKEKTLGFSETPQGFDYWCPVMSLPGLLGKTLENLHSPLQYLTPDQSLINAWAQKIGPRKKLRVGFSWRGRPDSWIHQHKSVPFDLIMNMIERNPQYQWINLQVDADDDETRRMSRSGVSLYPGSITCMLDTATLIANLDVVVSMDSAVSHLSGALGRPTWIMLNQYAHCWRWLLERGDSPWYPSVRLFRQPAMGQWAPVLDRVEKFLKTFTI